MNRKGFAFPFVLAIVSVVCAFTLYVAYERELSTLTVVRLEKSAKMRTVLAQAFHEWKSQHKIGVSKGKSEGIDWEITSVVLNINEIRVTCVARSQSILTLDLLCDASSYTVIQYSEYLV
ncbi:MAG: hypothetical protein ACRCWQ_04650 [Bacilli bacterium]